MNQRKTVTLNKNSGELNEAVGCWVLPFSGYFMPINEKELIYYEVMSKIFLLFT